MKKLKSILIATIIFLFSSSAFAQYNPGATYNTSHPAFSTAYSFNANSDYIRGFCHAFDGTQSYITGYDLEDMATITLVIGN